MSPKLAGILLFTFLLVPLAATLSFFHFQKSQVRKEVKHRMMEGIDRDELVLLRFTEEETRTKLRWEHSREFEYDGQMYDVVDKERRGDTIHYWCWWDHEETALNRQLDRLVAKVMGDNPKRQDAQNRILEFCKQLYCNTSSGTLEETNMAASRCPAYIKSHTAVFHRPPVPPPRFS